MIPTGGTEEILHSAATLFYIGYEKIAQDGGNYYDRQERTDATMPSRALCWLDSDDYLLLGRDDCVAGSQYA